MAKMIIVSVFLSNLAVLFALPLCCDVHNNYVESSKCAGGGPLITNMANCGPKFRWYADENDTEYYIDKAETLYIGDEKLAEVDKYCFSTVKSNNRNVYIVCMDLPDENFENMTRTLNIVVQLISVFFIILTVIVYLAVPQLLDLQGVSIIHSITGLALGYVMLAIVNLAGYLVSFTCHLVAYLLYVFILYAFFWQNILCFHMWRQVIDPRILKYIKSWKLIYHLYGVGGPLLCLIFVVVANHSNLPQFEHIHPGIAEQSCWFKSLRETKIYFYLPITILLAVNIVCFIWTAVVLWIQSQTCPNTKVLKFRLLLTLKLFFIMGLTWIFEVLSAILERETQNIKWIWIVTDSLNGLEGFIIFLILVVFRKRVKRNLANRQIFNHFRFPASWRNVHDSECEELEEEINLSTKD